MESAAAEGREATSELARRVAALESRSNPGSSALFSTPSASATDPFFVDRGIVRINVRATVPKEAIEKAIGPLLRAAKIPPAEARLDGLGMARNCVLRAPAGSSRLPDDLARAVLDAKKMADGSRRQINLATPNGGEVDVHVVADRSVAQRRVGWSLSTAAKIIREKYPQKVAKREGTITHQWEGLVHFVYVRETTAVDAQWGEATLTKYGMDPAALVSAFAIKVAAADEERRRRRG